MPRVTVDGRTIECPAGANLRRVLMAAGEPLYNGPMRAVHCRGLGSCGTCAVRVEGPLSPPTVMERWRLSFPPHRDGLPNGLRLACQCRVEGDLRLTKLGGWWGQGSADGAGTDD
ncbi:MAG: 2Fe-2S iron-sulfur cluster-binding protein [Planctomycetota bacterium]